MFLHFIHGTVVLDCIGKPFLIVIVVSPEMKDSCSCLFSVAIVLTLFVLAPSFLQHQFVRCTTGRFDT